MNNFTPSSSKFSIQFLFLLLTILGCQKDESIPDLENVEQNKNSKTLNNSVPNGFILNNFDDERVRNLKVDWSNPLIIENLKNGKTEEFSTDLQSSLYSENKNKQTDYTYKVLKHTAPNLPQPYFEIVQLKTSNSIKVKAPAELSLSNLDSFSGTITTYGSNGEVSNVKGFYQGAVKASWDNPPRPSDLTTKNPPPYGEGCFRNDRIESYADWYKNFGGSSSGKGGRWEYTHTTLVGVRYERVYVFDCGGPTVINYHEHRNGSGANAGNLNNNVNCDDEDIFEFDEDKVLYDEGIKPLHEYDDKCAGINKLWDLSVDSGNEFFAVLTDDGAILITQESGPTGGNINGLYEHEGTTYYQYPISEGSPVRDYNGMIEVANRYFIPVKATVHSHTPCINDGSDGITNNKIDKDQDMAQKHPNAKHYIVACSAIGEYNGFSNQAFNIEHGSLNNLCNNIN